MKKTFSSLLALVLLLCLLQVSHAQNNRLGIGVSLGDPSGISYKYWADSTLAISGLSSFQIRKNGSYFYTHLDFNKHQFFEKANWDAGYLGLFFGAGLMYEWKDFGMDDNFLTLRLPVGLNFHLHDLPFSFYFETAPHFTVYPDFHFFFNGNLGFRYYLN